jgi:AraC-like DNA-binding protein
MTDPPDFIAQTPDSVAVDSLSEVLDSVRFVGGHISAYRPLPSHRPIRASGIRSLLIVRAGDFQFCCDDAGTGPIALHPGDLVLLAFGSAFSMSRPKPAPGGRNGIAPPETCEWLHCTFDLDARLSDRLLSCLPRVVRLHHAGGAMDWLDITTAFALAEVGSNEPGAAVMVSRLMEVILIRVLRLFAVDPAAPPSWLAGATDPSIGRALGVMHANPGRRWSVPELARTATLSRSVFARRFAETVGEPPLHYLTGLRLDKAAELLERTGRSLADISEAVGYSSEPAFSRAFKVRFGASPSLWRRR